MTKGVPREDSTFDGALIRRSVKTWETRAAGKVITRHYPLALGEETQGNTVTAVFSARQSSISIPLSISVHATLVLFPFRTVAAAAAAGSHVLSRFT